MASMLGCFSFGIHTAGALVSSAKPQESALRSGRKGKAAARCPTEIKSRNDKNTCQICQRYAKDMPETCQRYAKDPVAMTPWWKNMNVNCMISRHNKKNRFACLPRRVAWGEGTVHYEWGTQALSSSSTRHDAVMPWAAEVWNFNGESVRSPVDPVGSDPKLCSHLI